MPRRSGVLTRSRGDFEEILAGSDLIVELIGGVDPARDYVLRAMRADPDLRSVPVVMLTSSREERDVLESYKLGVNA